MRRWRLAIFEIVFGHEPSPPGRGWPREARARQGEAKRRPGEGMYDELFGIGALPRRYAAALSRRERAISSLERRG